ncbi:UNVERIFIED_CONTAM: hypothetical protein RMT77_007172 [Armadillidium vulgare]|nr:Pre-rRNA-processing protein TSR2-like protein [Armadillidium vulgare]
MFKEDIDRILASWHALKFAVQQQTGGSESYAISKWMVGETETYFQNNDDLEADEVAEFLNSIMDSELNTLVADGSDLEIAQLLCKVYELHKLGNLGEIQNILSKLPSDSNQMDCSIHSDSDSEEGQTTQISNQISGMNISDSLANETSNTCLATSIDISDKMEEEDDGWIMVKKGKKKNR